MSAASIVAAGRAAAEALMSDTGRMMRPTGGRGPVDEDTGTEEELLEDLFTSSCKVQTAGLQATEAQAGARTTVTTRAQLHLPVGTPEVQVGDVFEVTVVAAFSDLQLLGRRYRVTAPVAKTYATARRFDVEELVA